MYNLRKKNRKNIANSLIDTKEFLIKEQMQLKNQIIKNKLNL